MNIKLFLLLFSPFPPPRLLLLLVVVVLSRRLFLVPRPDPEEVSKALPRSRGPQTFTLVIAITPPSHPPSLPPCSPFVVLAGVTGSGSASYRDIDPEVPFLRWSKATRGGSVSDHLNHHGAGEEVDRGGRYRKVRHKTWVFVLQNNMEKTWVRHTNPSSA